MHGTIQKNRSFTNSQHLPCFPTASLIYMKVLNFPGNFPFTTSINQEKRTALHERYCNELNLAGEYGLSRRSLEKSITETFPNRLTVCHSRKSFSKAIIRSRPRFSCRSIAKDLVQQLQGSVQLHFNPTGCFFDGLPVVIRPPSLDKTKTQDA